MKKFFGILFFYTVIFYKKESKESKGFDVMSEYINEKANRYLGINISKSDWTLLNIHLKDYPEPSDSSSADILKIEHLIGLVNIFNDIFGLDNLNHDDMNMLAFETSDNKKIFDEIYENFSRFVGILGSSNGVSIVLGRWLEKMEYNETGIQRELSLIDLGI